MNKSNLVSYKNNPVLYHNIYHDIELSIQALQKKIKDLNSHVQYLQIEKELFLSLKNNSTEFTQFDYWELESLVQEQIIKQTQQEITLLNQELIYENQKREFLCFFIDNPMPLA